MSKIGVAKINGVAVTACALCIAVGATLSRAVHQPAAIVVGALLGLYLLFGIKVIQQWEKVALLRLGRYVGLRGPGMFFIIPVVETLSSFVDQRDGRVDTNP